MSDEILTLQVDLGERSYPIYIGPDLLTQHDLLSPYVAGRDVMIVSNETVAPIYIEALRQGLSAAARCETVILPDGEQYKTLDVLNDIFDALLEQHFTRRCVLVALGGGVVGDMTGFAAACYQRGVDFIQVPTTLLSQVDSSVGGKTGVNHARGKNMIGAFHQPLCVLADTRTLNTLDDRQLHSGLAEVIKYGLIGDSDFFAWLEANMSALMSRDASALMVAIERSCRNKAEIVALDEREGGVRALLNFGHTFGHAIETGMGYGVCLHGEAVAIGMCMAARMSQALGWIDQALVQRIDNIMVAAELPVNPPGEMTDEQFLQLMAVDKKAEAGRIRLVLLQALGKAVLTDEYDVQQLDRLLKDLCEPSVTGSERA